MMLEDVQKVISNLSEAAEDVMKPQKFSSHLASTTGGLTDRSVAVFGVIVNALCSSSDEPNGSSSPEQTTHQSPSQLV
jgi:hypothetical protein